MVVVFQPFKLVNSSMHSNFNLMEIKINVYSIYLTYLLEWMFGKLVIATVQKR